MYASEHIVTLSSGDHPIVVQMLNFTHVLEILCKTGSDIRDSEKRVAKQGKAGQGKGQGWAGRAVAEGHGHPWGYLALRTWVSRPQHEVSGPGSQDLGFRPSTRGFRTWVSSPQCEVSGPGFQALDIWLSGPGFQDLESYASIVTFLFPVTFLCV